ncbi:AraC family transcriptional regulator [Streptomyces sp. NPDC056549]|uniref:AraC family transcriptional regulator n=1 Tax=Streptomyces sp. NPDC056549 TaxID=3345864 RepID=UPI0036CD13AC
MTKNILAPPWSIGFAGGTPLAVVTMLRGSGWTVSLGPGDVAVVTGAEPFSGEPPMTYLIGWRFAMAADLLARTDATGESIARQVDYQSAFGLSVAFKRVYGTRPSDHRAAPAVSPVG